ncbi:hypothetical protein KCU62_g170, partial [Aureobasidium sp. EXF-3399]
LDGLVLEAKDVVDDQESFLCVAGTSGIGLHAIDGRVSALGIVALADDGRNGTASLRLHRRKKEKVELGLKHRERATARGICQSLISSRELHPRNHPGRNESSTCHQHRYLHDMIVARIAAFARVRNINVTPRHVKTARVVSCSPHLCGYISGHKETAYARLLTSSEHKRRDLLTLNRVQGLASGDETRPSDIGRRVAIHVLLLFVLQKMMDRLADIVLQGRCVRFVRILPIADLCLNDLGPLCEVLGHASGINRAASTDLVSEVNLLKHSRFTRSRMNDRSGEVG